MVTSIAYNLANLALSASSTSNVNVAVFAGNVTTVQSMNAGNITVNNVTLGGSLVFSDGSSLSSVTSAISVFDYTGNGTQTVFATGNYNATSTLDTNVYISGVYQRKNTYTWSGTNITFTSGAPPLNSNIEIMVNTYATGIAVPNDGSVTPSKLSTGGPSWDANGNVAIGGTSIPTGIKLSVVAGSINVTDAAANTRAYLGWGIVPGSGGNGAYLFNADNSPLAFGTTNLERMRINSSGNVGIGTTTVAAGNALAVFGGNVQVGTTGNGVKFADGTYQSTAYSGSASGSLIKITYLTSGTSFTTQASTTKMFVELVGAGGGGAGTNNTSYTSSGGGAGGYSAKYFTGLTGGSSYTYAIGNGGTGGTSGTAGGNTTFTVAAVTITGNGGSGANTASGGAGGAASGGDINSNGQNGTTGFAAGGTALSGGNGTGGSSVFGGGGGSSAGYGGGGGSGAANSSTGYSGGSGLIRVWEYS